MQIERLIAGGAVVVVTATLTACGDDEPALTKPEFIEQADAICQQATDIWNPIFDAAWTSLGDVDEDTPEGQTQVFVMFDEVLEEVSPVWRDMADDLGDLRAPEDDEEQIADLVGDLHLAIDEMDRIIDDAVAGDELARARLDDSDPMADVDRRARDYGMTVCGREG